ncbi:TetR/AcrR family transcriptional regulator [Halorientalis brevis]|uniref:TetR/AcrR family transcriptional regulator n=1 Tax=Halorientalis brevis TaxID=1126241 RepID=A0ABD6CD69_9EURY|nr:TetR/AcrR family transcriptional regulator [Halorientalis brevis]
MAPPMELFDDEPTSTREAIMQATYAALAKHGYADLTIQRISDEFNKSKSLLYHHYDSKDALLVDFLGFMLEQMEADVPIQESGNAYDQLMSAFRHAFGELFEEPDFLRAVLELRAQAATDETYRRQFTANEEFIQSKLAEIVRNGIDEGTFRDVDPDRTAEMLLTVIDGAILRQATIDDVDVDVVRQELDAYVRSRLVTDDVEIDA